MFQIFQDSNGKYRWRAVAGNGEIVAQSEAYGTDAHAERGAIDLVKVVLQDVVRDISADPEWITRGDA